jgi:hypothetical protein
VREAVRLRRRERAAGSLHLDPEPEPAAARDIEMDIGDAGLDAFGA